MPERAHCAHCGQKCREPVDERFPARAREAYAARGYTTAATCDRGQARDVAATGWCFDRARRDPAWTGEELQDWERRGVGQALAEQDAARGLG